ncbi:MAG: arsenate reductase ArsC [Verrucomicrobiae bacterium]|nr:arsenate reductase ArsC [Verrucomicrobiae bacterium]
MRKRVLFLCTGNSCRSQMAEGWLRHVAGDRFEALSAGARPSGFVHPLAIRAMAEVGVDISRQRSKSITEFAGQPLDVVITVCDHARESCPVLPGAKQTVHWSFDDPAEATGSEEQRMVAFRRVREEIRRCVEQWVQNQGREVQ